MNLHYICLTTTYINFNSLREQCDDYIFKHYIIISDSQLKFLKFFFKTFLNKRNALRCYYDDEINKTYTFKEITKDEYEFNLKNLNKDSSRWAPVFNDIHEENENDNQKYQVAIDFRRLGFKFFSLTNSQIKMLDFLADYFGHGCVNPIKLTDQNFKEIPS